MLNRKTAPKPSGKIKFNLPQIKRNTLNSGIKIHSVIKNDLPVVQLNFLFSAGAKFEEPEKYGTAYLLSYLLDEGAGKYDSLSLSDEFEKLGIVFVLGADHDNIHLSALTLKEHLNRTLELISLIIKEPWLKENEFEREKKKLQAKLIQSLAHPSYLANILFEKVVFNQSFYSHPVMGNKKSLENIELNDVRNFYNRYITPSLLDIIAVGDFDETELTNKIGSYFDSWNNQSNLPDADFKVIKETKRIYIVDKPDSAQSEIRIGHSAGKRNTPDYFAKTMVNSILGGQFTSRLNSNLREEKGYTYGIRSSFVYNQDAGYFNISTSVDIENTIAAVKEIFKEFRGIRNGIKKEEIEFTRSFMIKRYPSLFETYSQISKNIASKVLHNLDDDYFNTYIDKIMSVTEEELQQTARDAFLPEEANIILVGDRKKIEPDLSELESCEIIFMDEDLNRVE